MCESVLSESATGIQRAGCIAALVPEIAGTIFLHPARLSHIPVGIYMGGKPVLNDQGLIFCTCFNRTLNF